MTRLLGALLCAVVLAPAPAFAQSADVPYVPTPQNVVDAMLDIAKVGPDDFVIDLGSGDGRIVITAAKKYGARGFGVELDGALVADARREAERQGVQDRARFLAQNLFITDIDRATVITSYLFPRINLQLRPRIFAETRPGTRVVSHEFDFGNWKPDAHVVVPVPGKQYGPPRSDVFLWVVPANAAGRWRWQLAGAEGAVFEVALTQTFQMLEGSARVDGREAKLASAKLNGAELSLVVLAPGASGHARYELTGRVEGDTVRGKARVTGADRELEWHATRIARGTIDMDAAAGAPALARND